MSGDTNSSSAASAAQSPVIVTKAACSAVKPGWQTTEFWMHALLLVGLVCGSVEGLPPKWAAIAAAVSTSAYRIARSITKLLGN